MLTNNVGQPGFVVGIEPIPLTLEETEAVCGGGGPLAAAAVGAAAGFAVVGGALAVGAVAGAVVGAAAVAGAVVVYNATTDTPPSDDRKPD